MNKNTAQCGEHVGEVFRASQNMSRSSNTTQLNHTQYGSLFMIIRLKEANQTFAKCGIRGKIRQGKFPSSRFFRISMCMILHSGEKHGKQLKSLKMHTTNIPILLIGILDFCMQMLLAPPLGPMSHLVHYTCHGGFEFHCPILVLTFVTSIVAVLQPH